MAATVFDPCTPAQENTPPGPERGKAVSEAARSIPRPATEQEEEAAVEVQEACDEAVSLRNLFCDVARSGLFHHLLTPSYDLAHKNHLHLDIKRDSKDLLVK